MLLFNRPRAAQPALNKRPDTPSMWFPADHRLRREKLSRCR